MRLALLVTAALLGAPAALAAAPDGPRATIAQLGLLAARAQTDPAALARLRAIGAVGGERIDLAAALDVRGALLARRLAALSAADRAAQPRASASGSPAAARSAAQAIVSQRRFRGSGVPQPLRRPLGWLGGLFGAVGRWIAKLGHFTSPALSTGGVPLEALYAAVVVGLTAIAVLGLARRRGRGALKLERVTRPGVADDARRLEQEADAAERAGAYEHAMRLRFRAGVLRLEQAGRVSRRLSLTNGAIARELGSSSFERVSHDFDEVVYGRGAASAEAAARARREWELVLGETRRP